MVNIAKVNAMTCGIYLILCHGRPYVGQSIHIEARWDAHLRLLARGAHDNPILQNVWGRHGESVFSFQILEECPRSVLSQREHWWCVELKSYNNTNGCNIVPVTKSQFYAGVRSPETISKHAAWMRTRIDDKRRFSPAEILDMWERYNNGESCESIARDYVVNRKSVWLIVTRQYYREIELPASCRQKERRRKGGGRKKKHGVTTIPTTAGKSIPSE